MRSIESHKTNPANAQLTVTAQDEPGSGGANHHYDITGFDSTTNPACPFRARYGVPATHTIILFQNGPINEDGVGVNGVTHEVLLAIIEDRLEAFQAGPYANKFNAQALEHLRAAQSALQARTQERTQRGVEGTHAI